MRRWAAAALVAGLVAPVLGVARPASADYMHPDVSKKVVVVPMTFPVVGHVSYSDSFLACRYGCSRPHYATDLMGTKMQKLVAGFDGYVSSLRREAKVGDGNYLSIQGDNGWSLVYIHVNNDSPGTDNGKGTERWSFTPGLHVGSRVFAGQQVGWLGDSGNAETTAPHSHIELWKGRAWDGTVYNPYASLRKATHLSAPRTSGPHPDGTLLRHGTGPTYLLEAGRKRHVSPQVMAVNGWTASRVISVSRNELRWYPTGPWVRVRGGTVGKDASGQTWLFSGGKRYPTSMAALASLGLSSPRVWQLTSEDLSRVPVAGAGAAPRLPWRSGALVRLAGTSQVWHVIGGERHLVPDTATLTSWGWTQADVAVVSLPTLPEPGLDPVTGLPLPAVDPMTLLPPVGAPLLLRDGTIVATGTYTALVSGGQRHSMPSPRYRAMFGYAGKPTVNPPSAVWKRVPSGTRLDALV